MFVSSTATLVPCVTFTKNHEIRFHVYSTTDSKFVEYVGDMYYQKGELLKDNDAPTTVPLFLTNEEAVRQAAKELLKSRPEPYGDDVAAVMLRDRDTTFIHWYRVSNKGTIKLFANADPVDSIINKEDGDIYANTTEIYFSPISAINAVKNYLENVCNDILREAAEREAKEQRDILHAKSFIDKINKAQEI
jgi:hypothetical protein